MMVQRLYPLAEALFPSEKPKFDAKVEISSKAWFALRKSAEEWQPRQAGAEEKAEGQGTSIFISLSCQSLLIRCRYIGII